MENGIKCTIKNGMHPWNRVFCI